LLQKLTTPTRNGDNAQGVNLTFCQLARLGSHLAFTRYCYYQYCMVCSIQTGGRKGIRILANSREIVLHQGGQCRWAGGMKGWLILAQQPRSKRISCQGQVRTGHFARAIEVGLYKILFCFGPLCTNQYYSLPNHPLFRQPTLPPSSSTLLRSLRSLPPPHYRNIYYTILAMVISCKGQHRG